MIKALVSDLSRTLIFVKDPDYKGSMNSLYRELANNEGFNVFDHFTINDLLLDYYRMQLENLTCYLFTSGAYLFKDPLIEARIEDIFQEVITPSELEGTPKDDPEAYKKLSAYLGYEPDEIIFIDDSKANILAAEKAGYHTVHFRTTDQAREELEVKLIG